MHSNLVSTLLVPSSELHLLEEGVALVLSYWDDSKQGSLFTGALVWSKHQKTAPDPTFVNRDLNY